VQPWFEQLNQNTGHPTGRPFFLPFLTQNILPPKTAVIQLFSIFGKN
jgi:hypothetical protein